MELLFLGRGNSTNYLEGNNSAFFIESDNLFLIDCGETVFSKILEKNILDKINHIHVMITHTHSDHIGSLASLIMYEYFNKQIKVNIILPGNAKHRESIQNIVDSMGCSGMYNIYFEDEYDDKYESFQIIQYLETSHVDYLDCYSIVFYTDYGIVFYSGDSKDMNNINNLLNRDIEIDKLYVDVTSNDSVNNIHLYIGTLIKNIGEDLKSKVYCMHFNNNDCIEKAIRYGLGIAKKV